MKICTTSGFWPRVRARALRAPFSLSSLPLLRCFLFDPQKYIKSIELGPPTSRAFFFPLDHRGSEIRGPLPGSAHRTFAYPSGNILRLKLCTGAKICHTFFRFFFSIVFGSFLFVILFFFISPFQFHLILVFLSFSSYLFLFFSQVLFFVFLFFSSYILNCLLYYRHAY